MTKTSIMKTIMGALILLLAAALLVFWEVQGREMFLMDEVLVARDTISAGTKAAPELFKTVSVPKNALVEKVVAANDIQSLSGKVVSETIRKGAQLSAASLKNENEKAKPQTSCFVIKNDWLDMCTSSLRRGDNAEILSQDGRRSFGVFSVAYVKDAEGREVADAAAGMKVFSDPDEGRANPSAPIHHLEIRCEWSKYKPIKDYCEKGGTILVVRKEEVL